MPVYELGHRLDGTLYYTMKLVRGRTLSSALREAKDLAGRLKFLPHLLDICQAIAYAHSRKVIHRDIKPSNIMVGEFGETVVLDWGLAKHVDSVDIHESGLQETLRALSLGDETRLSETAYGQALGTPVYMPPEQAKGLLEQIDQRSDVYSLGAVLYELLTGTVPFEGRSVSEILQQVTEARPRDVSKLEPNAPRELVAVALRALEKLPENRYQSASEFAEDLASFMSGAEVKAYSYNAWELLGRFLARHRKVLLSASIAGVLLVLSSIVYARMLVVVNRELQQAKTQESIHRSAAESEAKRARAAEVDARAAQEVAENQLYVANVLSARGSIEEGDVDQALWVLWQTAESRRGWEWGYLLKQADPSLLTISTPGGNGNAEFSPDGASLLTVEGYSLEQRDAISGELLKRFSGHSGYITHAEFGPSGFQIVSSSDDGTARVWDVATGATISILEPSLSQDPQILESVFGDSDKLVATSSREAVHIWLTDLSNLQREPKLTIEGTSPVALSRDGKYILTGRTDRVARISDVSTGEVKHMLSGHDDNVTCAAFSKSGALVATGSHDKTVKIWEVESGSMFLTLAGHEDYVTSVAFAPDDSSILSASYDGTIRLWNLQTGETKSVIKGHSQPVWQASFSPDGRRIASASADGTTKIWESALNVDAPTLRLFWREPNSAYCSPDGTRVVLSSDRACPSIWSLETGKKLLDFDGGCPGGTNSAKFDAIGERIVTASSNGDALIWDAASGNALKVLQGGGVEALDACFDPSGKKVAAVYGDGKARIWEADSGKLSVMLPVHGEAATSVSFSPDGVNLLTGSLDGSARVWSMETGRSIVEFKGHAQGITRAVFSPNGNTVLTASLDGTVRIWEYPSGTPVRTLEGHAFAIHNASFSPDGRRISTASEDGRVRVWDAQTGHELIALAAHTQFVRSAVFTPDGRSLVSAGREGIVKVWTNFPFNESALPAPIAADEKWSDRYERWKSSRYRDWLASAQPE